MKQKPKKKPIARRKPAKLPIVMLRMVVQVEDTPNNRNALAAARMKLMREASFDGIENAVKMEQTVILSLCVPSNQPPKP